MVVGLGNPGARYSGTRHNAGQMVVEELARRLDAGRFAKRFAEARGPSGPLALLVPTTYMNDSGGSAGPAAGALRIGPDRVLVVHDEIDLPFGVLRGKVGGGHGGHNGLRSLVSGLGGAGFARLRVGVGRPPAEFRGDAAAWVLARFSEPPGAVTDLIGRAADFAELAVGDGMEAAIARFHAAAPGERARRRRSCRDAAGPDAEPGPLDAADGDPPS